MAKQYANNIFIRRRARSLGYMHQGHRLGTDSRTKAHSAPRLVTSQMWDKHALVHTDGRVNKVQLQSTVNELS